MAAPKRPQRAKRDGSTAKPRVAKSSAVPSVAAQLKQLGAIPASTKKAAAPFFGSSNDASRQAKPSRSNKRGVNVRAGNRSIPVEIDESGYDGGPVGTAGDGGPDSPGSGGGNDIMRMLLEEVRELTRYLKQKFDAD